MTDLIYIFFFWWALFKWYLGSFETTFTWVVVYGLDYSMSWDDFLPSYLSSTFFLSYFFKKYLLRTIISSDFQSPLVSSSASDYYDSDSDSEKWSYSYYSDKYASSFSENFLSST